MQLVHVSITCSDLEKSVAFYKDLGFTPLGEVPTEFVESSEAKAALDLDTQKMRFVYLRSADASTGPLLQLVQYEPETEGGAAPPTGVARIALMSGRFEKLHTDLKAREGTSVTEPAVLTTHRFRVASTKDPDGTTVELVEPSQAMINALRPAMPELW